MCHPTTFGPRPIVGATIRLAGRIGRGVDVGDGGGGVAVGVEAKRRPPSVPLPAKTTRGIGVSVGSAVGTGVAVLAKVGGGPRTAASWLARYSSIWPYPNSPRVPASNKTPTTISPFPVQ